MDHCNFTTCHTDDDGGAMYLRGGLAILSLNASFRVAVQVIALGHWNISLSHPLQQLLILILLQARQAAI
jgi:hypothetical protein